MAKENFFSAHWDWLVALLGVLALVGAGLSAAEAFGTSEDDARAEADARIKGKKPAHEGVAATDLTVLNNAFNALKKPPTLSEVMAKKGSFLASERRVVCKAADGSQACGMPIPAGLEVCPLCKAKQSIVKVELDSDHDGLPNDWEAKYGLNPNDASDAEKDADGDGFTNLEEYAAKTNPTDKFSHPEYIDFLTVQGGLKETYLPFYFKEANPIPGGHRITFLRTDSKSKIDNKFMTKVGEEIASEDGKIKTGYMLKQYDEKHEKRKIAGSKSGQEKSVNVSTVTLVRTTDKKELVARIGERKVPVESEAELFYDRNGGKKFVVHVGQEIDLNGEKWRIIRASAKGKGAEVVLLNEQTKKEKIINPLAK